MLIDRLFAPSNCVQGGELPIYLLWPKDRELEIEIQLPTKFEILEIYNAQKPRIMEGNILRATEFEENGYLGLLVKTPRLDEHTKDTEILFEIISPDGQRQQEKKFVHLFRQSVKVISIPKYTIVKKHLGKGKVVLKDKISITNEGEGIAVIGFKLVDDSELKISEPKGTADFRKNFWSDWSVGLSKIKKGQPNYSSLIDSFIKIGNSQLILDEEGVEKIRDVFGELEESMQNDIFFADELIKSLVVAYMKNVNVLVEIESFVTYLNSIDAGRIIINNPTDVIKIGKKPKKFSAELQIVDLVYNSYPSVPIELELSADDDCEIPIYDIINVINKNIIDKEVPVKC